MRFYLYILLISSLSCISQQSSQFTQFTFNKYGYNPAAAGTSSSTNLEAIIGTRKQWVGFTNAPVTNFLSVNYSIKPKKTYKLWHNVGFYMAKDNAGLFHDEAYYASYALHVPVSPKYTMAFGLFVGTRSLAFNRGAISSSDPVYASTASGYFFLYPDFVPGLRLYNKKMFFDVSVQHLYKNKPEQGANRIGDQSKFDPLLYVSYGKKFSISNGITLVPSVNLHSTVKYIPSVEVNMMAYYGKRIGVGASIRGKNFISGMLQVRLIQNITAGFAYDYSINHVHSYATNTVEFMIGITPIMRTMEVRERNTNVSSCPSFDF